MAWLDTLKKGLKKTSALFVFTQMDEQTRSDLEDALIMADVGAATTDEILTALDETNPKDLKQLNAFLKEQIITRLKPVAHPLNIETHHPFVLLMIGVNGAGKTTTIGKLAATYKQQGKTVSLIAGDTFRAGAVEQLQTWGKRIGVSVFAGAPNADPASVVFDGLTQSLSLNTDVVLIDTAGRLHNKTNLMDELKKIKAVIQKIIPDAPHATCLVLDASVGQNALNQVETFRQIIGVDGLIMTKLDGTAKGGILLALTQKFNLPIYAIGVGERVEDLHAFTAEEYADSLLKDFA